MAGLYLPKPNVRFRQRLLHPRSSLLKLVGGGALQGHTMLTAQKYEVNWKDLESAFPQMVHFETYDQKWRYLESLMGPQGTSDPEMWNYVNRFRSKKDLPSRRVKDRVVTTAFVDFIVDQLQTETSVFGDFKYHENGLGVTGEAAGDTDVETATGIARATGTQTETDHDTYKSVATITADATEAWTEHCLFNDASAGTLADRTVHGALNVVSGNQVEYTFEISFTAGG